ncbi:hypothetical protein HanPSC8_Chr17g0752711 [Helianthus annuus]|nr:hypothetical protein HanPSC8_Chr17g0752711 [Helianthus annuus]
MIMSVGLDLCFHLRFLSDEEAGCEGANGLGQFSGRFFDNEPPRKTLFVR